MKSMPKKPMVCCKKSVSVDQMAHLFPRGFVAEYRRIQVEFDTEDKLYCGFKECSAFISPHTIDGKNATCWERGRQTCTLCKSGSHRGKDQCEFLSTRTKPGDRLCLLFYKTAD